MEKMVYKVDIKKCGLSEMNRELKRLASIKCRKKGKEEAKIAQRMYEELVEIKNKRFGGKSIKKCNYMELSLEEINGLSLEELRKGLNVIYSMRCYYKGNEKKSKEVEKMFKIYSGKIKEMEDLKVYEELKKKFS